jgi:cold shock CspA family protein
MAKSRETYSKKEKEKKRLKKKQDKEQKMEARKTQSNKGKGLDDMLAYVDENGNISETPPDPQKKKTVKAETIEVSVSRQADLTEEDLIRKGVVTFFNTSKGYGFIRDSETDENIFVHANALVDQIKDKDKVSFEVERTPKGLNALSVKVI